VHAASTAASTPMAMDAVSHAGSRVHRATFDSSWSDSWSGCDSQRQQLDQAGVHTALKSDIAADRRGEWLRPAVLSLTAGYRQTLSVTRNRDRFQAGAVPAERSSSAGL
jgi:hypothetical protein